VPHGPRVFHQHAPRRGHGEYVEESLWTSIRAIEESALLLQQLGEHARDHVKDAATAKLFDEKAQDTLSRANVVRTVTNDHQTLSKDNIHDVASGAR
jgi:two-component system chemotaxis response regulator CheB